MSFMLFDVTLQILCFVLFKFLTTFVNRNTFTNKISQTLVEKIPLLFTNQLKCQCQYILFNIDQILSL